MSKTRILTSVRAYSLRLKWASLETLGYLVLLLSFNLWNYFFILIISLFVGGYWGEIGRILGLLLALYNSLLRRQCVFHDFWVQESLLKGECLLYLTEESITVSLFLESFDFLFLR
jgi:hypothetical protein